MLQHKLYLTIIVVTCFSPNFAIDFYSKFHQKDYKIDFQRLELFDYNKSIYNVFEVKTFKYNRTCPVANVTINSKINMNAELEVAVQFYKFLSNEYRRLPGSNFKINFCKTIKENLLGSEVLVKCGNFTPCKFVQGTTYKACNVFPDESRFPSFIPNGEYKFQVDLVYEDDITATLDLYIKIYRPIPIPKKRKTV